MKLDLTTLKVDSTTKGIDVLLKKVEERMTNSGKPYCYLTITDGLRDYNANYWEHTKEQLLSKVMEKSVVTADIHAKIFREVLGYEIRAISMPDHPVDISEFVRKPQKNIEDMYTECLTMLDPESIYGKIVGYIYTMFMTPLCKCAGAEKVHHDYMGGLLEHQYGVAKVAEALCQVYPDLDRDMLVAGALIHDIGKIYELNTDEIGSAEFTLSGMQVGHSGLGIKILMRATLNLNLYNTKEREVLEAMIASHHGKQEYGALAKPNFLEAYMLHMADMIDSRKNIFDKEYEKLEPGQVSDSRIYFLDNVKAWRP